MTICFITKAFVSKQNDKKKVKKKIRKDVSMKSLEATE
jgi:hypothetical protein